MTLDQATQAFLSQMAASGSPPMTELSPAEARQSGAAITQMIGPGPEVAAVHDHTLTAEDGSRFGLRVIRPAAQVASVVVYFHGGGWVVGDIDGFDTLGRKLANASDSTVVLVNYRKAPEHPYPAAVDDAWRALEWVTGHLCEIAGSDVPVVVAGDSAGGNLAAVIARRARDRKAPKLAHQILIYPVTDSDLDAPQYHDPANQLMLDRASMVWFWDHYASPERRCEPDASPLRAADLSALPPATVLVAEHDVLRVEGEAYAAALEKAGVPTVLHLCEGQMHGFFSMINILPGSAVALDLVAATIRGVQSQEEAR
ncbi:alpha/beta hydrolase [Streptomyces mexicanus]|jgi:acetyl esterase|uniref:Alpha/beta hydrolase n=1 Tax=Streptomyces mexicanus TaxID=178566 RepID=A0A7X1LR36_9ACTN|nr:alpha/beta hydrolase [Streptomyces mexicanus]MBC2865001.1 alpha/beta hydrolase [Streptomyces mexicanus]